nr:MiaB/RimO family radical SAM methylthiotransferase [Thermoanaerobaculia bacterium]
TVLTGCYASAGSASGSLSPEADLVVPNHQKQRLVSLVEAAFSSQAVEDAVDPQLPYLPFAASHARATVKIGDGCDHRCAFCIIPSTRGREWSRPAEEVVEEVRGLVAGGYREVVLTGVQISDWHEAGRKLSDLVARLLGETAVERLRLTSVAPWNFDSRLLALFADRRLCRHLHLSLQSGCSATLRRMRRPYTAERYESLVAQITEQVPGIGLTTDVIVGFPGETAVEHRESLERVAALPFARVHVFRYSPRPGTVAAAMPGAVTAAEARARTAEMLEAAQLAQERFTAEQRGQVLPVLWETNENGAWQGYSDNYLRVHTKSPGIARNHVTATRILGPVAGGAAGEVIP